MIKMNFANDVIFLFYRKDIEFDFKGFKKRESQMALSDILAETVGLEPTWGLTPPIFKTGSLANSDTSPLKNNLFS